MNTCDKPLAAAPLTSYRYAGRYGWIMIGATDIEHALKEAARSTVSPEVSRLQVWNGREYVAVKDREQ